MIWELEILNLLILNTMSKNYKNQNQQTALEIILIGIFKVLWWIITLPFNLIFKKGKKLSGRLKITPNDWAYIVSQRLEIEKILKSENQIELKHAVMEADKLVDYIFQAKNYQGETFADRLRSAESFIEKDVYNSIWNGHKVRNQIAHENELRITNDELRSAAENLLRYTKNI